MADDTPGRLSSGEGRLLPLGGAQGPVREGMTIRPLSWAPRPCQCASAGHMMRQHPRSATRSPVRRAAFVVTFKIAEMMAMRSEDRNARQRQQTFPDGATLAELEKDLALLRSLGAPGDAHPRVGVNDDYEITWMACVVQRRTLDSSRR